MRSAKENIKDSNHEYLPILAVPSFRTLAMDLVFGKSSAAVQEERVSIVRLILGIHFGD
jgi:aspartate aminotransferase